MDPQRLHRLFQRSGFDDHDHLVDAAECLSDEATPLRGGTAADSVGYTARTHPFQLPVRRRRGRHLASPARAICRAKVDTPPDPSTSSLSPGSTGSRPLEVAMRRLATPVHGPGAGRPVCLITVTHTLRLGHDLASERTAACRNARTSERFARRRTSHQVPRTRCTVGGRRPTGVRDDWLALVLVARSVCPSSDCRDSGVIQPMNRYPLPPAPAAGSPACEPFRSPP